MNQGLEEAAIAHIWLSVVSCSHAEYLLHLFGPEIGLLRISNYVREDSKGSRYCQRYQRFLSQYLRHHLSVCMRSARGFLRLLDTRKKSCLVDDMEPVGIDDHNGTLST